MKKQQALMAMALVVAVSFRPVQCTGAEGTPLTITLIDGATVTANVSATGETTISVYPSALVGEFTSVRFPYGALVSTLSETTCKKVERMALAAADPTTPTQMRTQYKSFVRSLTSTTLDISFPTIVSPQWLWNEIKKKANAEGVTVTSLKNPISTETVTLELELSEHAITGALDGVAQLSQELASMLSARSVSTGRATVVTPALDLLCDLKSGKAKVILKMSGSELNRPTYGFSMPLDHAAFLSSRLRKSTEDFLASPSAINTRRNFLRAGILAERFNSEHGTNLSMNDFAHSIEALLDPETALPTEMSESVMKKALTVIRSPHSRYNGGLTLQWNAKEIE